MENLRILRERTGLSQKEVAHALEIKQNTVSMWETSESMPRADKLPKLAKLYNCSIDELYSNG